MLMPKVLPWTGWPFHLTVILWRPGGPGTNTTPCWPPLSSTCELIALSSGPTTSLCTPQKKRKNEQLLPLF
jgi:hypothetical protein